MVLPGLVIPAQELQWRFSASGGPGGQHANTSNTRVEVRFDIAASPSLTAVQRQRLVARLGPEVRVVCLDARSQYRNRQLAGERLAERLREGLRVPTTRHATRRTKGSVQRRLVAKSRRADIKRGRGRPTRDD